VRPDELPPCDVLELDCEGSEVGILRDMLIEPRIVAVETHGFLGAPTGDVRNVLENRGYQVSDLGFAEPRLETECAKRDIRVLVGKKSPAAESA
jgi:Methyltransferase FkbM domain